MRKSRYSDSQILAILEQDEQGASVPDLCREHGMSSAQFYKWRAKFGGMDVSLMKRMKALEGENRRLKKLLSNGMRTEATVTQIAMSNGFTQLGRFSSIYKKVFGELPSETLRRPS